MDLYIFLVLVYLALIIPLFLGVGFTRYSTPQWLYLILFILGVIIVTVALLYKDKKITGVGEIYISLAIL